MLDDKAFPLTRDSIEREFVNFGCHNTELRFFSSVDSTNLRAREYLTSLTSRLTHPTVFAADEQTAGRGRLGRRFESRGGVGLYMTLVLPMPEATGDISTLTAYVAVMAARSIKELTGEWVDIKWVNDLYLGGRKLAGILCEGVLSPDNARLEYAIIGIGVNVRKTEFPEELRDIATDIETETGLRISRAALLASIVKKLTDNLGLVGTRELLDEYRSHSFLIGAEVTVYGSGDPFSATVLEIDDRAALIVRDEVGELHRLIGGEVSVRKNKK